MSRAHSLALVVLLSPLQATAGELSLNYAQWDYSVAGFADDGARRLDFERDLRVRADGRGRFELNWETPERWPDAVLSYTRVKAAGQRTAEDGGGLLGLLPGSSSTTASVHADFDDLGLCLRYPLSRQPTRLLVGLALTQLRGSVSVRQEGDAEETREQISDLFPMGHVRAESVLADWLHLSAAANYIRYQGDRAANYQVEARLSWGALTFNLGWLKKAYRVSGESYLLDADLSGPYAGAGVVIP